MLGADSALADIICYIGINARPVYCPSCWCLHLLYPLVGSIYVSEGMVKEFGGNADTASLEEEAGLYGQFIPGTSEVLGHSWGLLRVIWPSPTGEVVQCAVHQVPSSNGIQLGSGQLDMLDVLCYGYGEILCGRGSNLGGWLSPFLYRACIEWCSCTCRRAYIEVRGELHGWAFAGSFQVAYGHSVQSHTCHIVMCEISQGQSTLTDTLSQYLHSRF